MFKNINPHNKNRISISKSTWIYIATIFLFISAYNIIPNNLTLYITEENMGNSSIAGIVMSIFLLGGAVGGILYGFIRKLLQDKIIILGFCLIIIGCLILFNTNNLYVVFLAVFLAGASVSFVMSQCICRVSEIENKSNVTTAMAILMAFNSTAQFFAPFFTKISSIIFNNNEARYRLLLTMILGIVLTIIVGLLLLTNKKKELAKQNEFIL